MLAELLHNKQESHKMVTFQRNFYALLHGVIKEQHYKSLTL